MPINYYPVGDNAARQLISAKGFEVDFLRRQPEGDDPHPFRFSADEEDLSPIQAVRASVLTTAPQTFIEFKLWMAEHAVDRPEIKRRRGRRQAAIVQELLDTRFLIA